MWLVNALTTDSQPPMAPIDGTDAADTVLGRAFELAGLLGDPLPGGKRMVRCPWLLEHSDGRGDGHDSSTVVLPPTTEGRWGAFHCSHAHCAGRRFEDVMAVLIPIDVVREARTKYGRPRVDAPRVELDVPDDDAREPEVIGDEPSPATPETSKPASRVTLTIVSAAEMARPLPPIPWLVKGLRIAPGAPTLVAGYGFSGKTVFVQSLALAVACGRSVLGFPARKGRVLHLDCEQGSRVTFERYQRLAHACGLELAGLASLESVILPPTIEVRADAVDVLSQSADGRALVIVDSWRPAHPGIDENSSDVRATLDVFGEVSERTGCAFVLIHHSRKPDKDSKGGAKMAVRGSSGFFDGSQCVITLAGEPGEPISIECHKDRVSGQPFEPFNAQILDVDDRRGLSFERVDTVDAESARAEAAKARSAEKASARAATKAAELALEEQGRAVADALRDSTQERAFIEILREHPAGITSRDMLSELRARLRSVTNGAESEIAARLANRLGQAVQRLKGVEGFYHNAKVFRLVESDVPDALRGDDALRVGSV
jgi:hypothetical protein